MCAQEDPASASAPSASVFVSNQARWLAVVRRSPAAHAAFFYAVKTTRIYCRPTCSARLARRANVVFYDGAEQAQRDGYRACKRCRPADPVFVGEGEQVVARALSLMGVGSAAKSGSGSRVHLKSLARDVGVTQSHLCRVFKKTMGVTVGAFLKELKSGAGGTTQTTHTSHTAHSTNDAHITHNTRMHSTTTHTSHTTHSQPVFSPDWQGWLAKVSTHNKPGPEPEPASFPFSDWLQMDRLADEGLVESNFGQGT